MISGNILGRKSLASRTKRLSSSLRQFAHPPPPLFPSSSFSEKTLSFRRDSQLENYQSKKTHKSIPKITLADLLDSIIGGLP